MRRCPPPLCACNPRWPLTFSRARQIAVRPVWRLCSSWSTFGHVHLCGMMRWDIGVHIGLNYPYQRLCTVYRRCRLGSVGHLRGLDGDDRRRLGLLRRSRCNVEPGLPAGDLDGDRREDARLLADGDEPVAGRDRGVDGDLLRLAEADVRTSGGGRAGRPFLLAALNSLLGVNLGTCSGRTAGGYDVKYGCLRISAAVIRLAGSSSSMRSSRSLSCAPKLANAFLTCLGYDVAGRAVPFSAAGRFVGVPHSLNMRSSWSISVAPCKIGRCVNISANTHLAATRTSPTHSRLSRRRRTLTTRCPEAGHNACRREAVLGVWLLVNHQAWCSEINPTWSTIPQGAHLVYGDANVVSGRRRPGSSRHRPV